MCLWEKVCATSYSSTILLRLLSKFKRIKIIPSAFSDWKLIKLETNDNRISRGKNPKYVEIKPKSSSSLEEADRSLSSLLFTPIWFEFFHRYGQDLRNVSANNALGSWVLPVATFAIFPRNFLRTN